MSENPRHTLLCAWWKLESQMIVMVRLAECDMLPLAAGTVV